MSTILILSISALGILLMLLRPKNLPEVYWVGTGAALLVVLRLIPLRIAAKAIAEGSDVYLFLIGMMLLSALARDNGVFDWIASGRSAQQGARASGSLLSSIAWARL